MIATIRRAAAGLGMLLTLAGPARAQITTGDVYVRITGGVTAADEPSLLDTQSIRVPAPGAPPTFPIVDGSASGDLSDFIRAKVGGGEASLDSQGSFLVTRSNITASASYALSSKATGASAAAQAGVDMGLQVTFTVSEHSTFAVRGKAFTSNAIPSAQLLQCTVNQTYMVGPDPTTLPTGVDIDFQTAGEIHPGETAAVACNMIRGIGQTAGARVSWSFNVDVLPVPTTTTTLPRKVCKQSCRRAKAACRASCGDLTTGKERKSCRLACRRSAKRCGPSTGCTL